MCVTHSQACARQGGPLSLESVCIARTCARAWRTAEGEEAAETLANPVTAVQREAGQEPSYPSCIYPSLLSSFSLFLQFLFHPLPTCSRLQLPPLCMQGLLYWAQSCPGQSGGCTVACMARASMDGVPAWWKPRGGDLSHTREDSSCQEASRNQEEAAGWRRWRTGGESCTS